jgi:small redox-active disulfide protein 2
MEIKILGTGCPNCKRLEKLARQAVAELGIEAQVTKVQDLTAIMAYDIVSTPGLVVDEQVVASGRVPPKDEVVALLRKATQ